MALYDPARTPAQQAMHSFLTDTPWTMGAASQLSLSHVQVGNFAVLASYLRRLPPEYPKFGMRNFYVDRTSSWTPEDAVKIKTCGTSACAAGHGPAAGVAVLPGESWGVYIDRAFCQFGGTVYLATFSECWATVDDTAQGAAARILFLLDNPGHLTDLAHKYDAELYESYLA